MTPSLPAKGVEQGVPFRGRDIQKTKGLELECMALYWGLVSTQVEPPSLHYSASFSLNSSLEPRTVLSLGPALTVSTRSVLCTAGTKKSWFCPLPPRGHKAATVEISLEL